MGGERSAVGQCSEQQQTSSQYWIISSSLYWSLSVCNGHSFRSNAHNIYSRDPQAPPSGHSLSHPVLCVPLPRRTAMAPTGRLQPPPSRFTLWLPADCSQPHPPSFPSSLHSSSLSFLHMDCRRWTLQPIEPIESTPSTPSLLPFIQPIFIPPHLSAGSSHLAASPQHPPTSPSLHDSSDTECCFVTFTTIDVMHVKAFTRIAQPLHSSCIPPGPRSTLPISSHPTFHAEAPAPTMPRLGAVSRVIALRIITLLRHS